jgi:hypothetical protein
MRAFVAGLIALCLAVAASTAQTNKNYVPTPAPRPGASQPADPNAEQTMLWALGEVAGELQLCSVCFGFVGHCVAAQWPDLARTYRAAADKLNELALKSHLAAGLSADAYIAMLPLHAENMRELLGNRASLGNNCSNIAVLLGKYMNFCKRLSQDADPRLQEWITCIRARQQTCGGP